MTQTQHAENKRRSKTAVDETVLFVGDVGGTNARFSVFAAGASDLSAEQALAAVSLPTADFVDTPSMVREALARLGAAQSPLSAETSAATGRSDTVTAGTLAAGVIAIAGPVSAGSGQLTNGVLKFDEAHLAELLGCPVRLVNDFYAVAASINDATPVQSVGTKLAPIQNVRAVLGPGTGLGMGYLVPFANDWHVFASEGGNADFAPVDALELELLGILQRSFAPVSIETLVSGRGLPNLYAALCELWGAPVEHTRAEAISAAALSFGDSGSETGDTLSHKTLELFCALLGTAAGNFALNVGARGGVYLAGGILPRMQDFFSASEFRRRFDDRGALADFNQQIPTFLVLDPEPGLTGAVRLARRLLT